MTAYAPNFTARLRVKYHAALANHSQTWRFPSFGVGGAGLAAAEAAVQAFYDDIAPVMYDDWAFISSSFADVDSDVFLPAASFTLTGTITTPTTDPSIKAGGVSFVGRSSGGQPAKVFQYGISVPISDSHNAGDFRINPTEIPEIDTAIAELNGFIAGLVLCGSDGQAVTWYPYANFKDMDYWVKRIRQGS